MFRRAGGTFYARDKVTGKGESLKTEDKAAARQRLVTMNQTVFVLNLFQDYVRGRLCGNIHKRFLSRTVCVMCSELGQLC